MTLGIVCPLLGNILNHASYTWQRKQETWKSACRDSLVLNPSLLNLPQSEILVESLLDLPGMIENPSKHLFFSMVACAESWRVDYDVDMLKNQMMSAQDGAFDEANKCFNASAWIWKMRQLVTWKYASQFQQDMVLSSLFSHRNLGSTNQFYVEFGFDAPEYIKGLNKGANTHLFHKMGWQGLLLDESNTNPYINLHTETITPATVIPVFQKYNVPKEPDYVSIDIDSYDLQVFLALTEIYRPRVMTVEYNAIWNLEESKTLRAALPRSEQSQTNAYAGGSSLRALHKAAQIRNYTIVYVVYPVDIVLVRDDLMCPGSWLDVEAFRNFTGAMFISRAFSPDLKTFYHARTVDF
eukprot:gnl/TRDRNA2_/TRDRNA2_61466_c0_seq1.p1 gnl/TRDRNA2_/TRDRNA2_61466_c0~~gnl/TRDRNA2_/TRDRNA2_61466_c0_seq1.p1  ORF type:complete len:353 (-),score=29.51 gnl/TRDRNA2_/TRDRNA2_61466_c0_seq1:46-1104(-)